MKKILVLFAHPRYEKSRANKALLTPLADQGHVTLHDLYETYPDFNIDLDQEKALLLSHQIIVWHFPFYMYSAPAMIKQWIDLVLEHGWAHGAGGDKLENKFLFCAVTTGGTRESYSESAFNRHSMDEFLLPFQQTARLCNLTWLPPFLVQGTYRLSDKMLSDSADQYRLLLDHMAHHAVNADHIRRFRQINDWVAQLQTAEQQ